MYICLQISLFTPICAHSESAVYLLPPVCMSICSWLWISLVKTAFSRIFRSEIPFPSSLHTQVQHSRRRDSTTRRLPRRAARNNRFQHVSFPTIINFLSPQLVPSPGLRVQSNYPISSNVILSISNSIPFRGTTELFVGYLLVYTWLWLLHFITCRY